MGGPCGGFGNKLSSVDEHRASSAKTWLKNRTFKALDEPYMFRLVRNVACDAGAHDFTSPWYLYTSDTLEGRRCRMDSRLNM